MTAALMIKPLAAPAEILKLQDEIARLIQEALKEGVDYGVIPGTGDKPALFKPGAERLCTAFGAHPEYELIESQIDHHAEVAWLKRKKIWRNKHPGDREFHWGEENGRSLGLYRYRYRCKIVLSDGRVIATAEGVCSTLESKYIDRPRDCENTVCKMAQKRAFVAASLHAFALSNRFTQDVEDMDRDTYVDAQPAAPRQQARQQAKPTEPPPPPPPPAQEPATAKKGQPFDIENEAHRGAVTAILDKRKIAPDLQGAILGGMKGRPFVELESVIKQVLEFEAKEAALNAGQVIDADFVTEGAQA